VFELCNFDPLLTFWNTTITLMKVHLYIESVYIKLGACGSIIEADSVLQALRSWVRFPVRL
jgi:hypothetical protein